MVDTWRPLLDAMLTPEEAEARAQEIMEWQRNRLIKQIRLAHRDAQSPIFDQLNRERGLFRA